MNKSKHFFARHLLLGTTALLISACGGNSGDKAENQATAAVVGSTVETEKQDPVVQTRADDSSFSGEPFSIPMYLNDANSALLQGSTVGTGNEKNSDLIKRLSVDSVSGESSLDVVDAYYVQNGKSHSVVYVVQNNTEALLCGGHFEEPRLADKSGNPVSNMGLDEFFGTPITINLDESKKATVNRHCIGPGDALYSGTVDYYYPFKLKENKEIVLPDHIPEKVAGFTGELRVFEIPDNPQFDQGSVKPLSYSIDSSDKIRVLMENQHPTQVYATDARLYPLDTNGFPLAVLEDRSTRSLAPGEQKIFSFENSEFSGTAHSLRVVTKVYILDN